LTFPFELLLEHGGALSVLADLFYRDFRGRVAQIQAQMDVVVPAVLALAKENDRIDEETLKDALDGIQPSDLVEGSKPVPS
jgi:hypothetical protein